MSTITVVNGGVQIVEVAKQGPPGISGGGVIAQDTAPLSPSQGQQWYKTDSDELYVYRITEWQRIPLVAELDGVFGAVVLNGGYF